MTTTKSVLYALLGVTAGVLAYCALTGTSPAALFTRPCGCADQDVDKIAKASAEMAQVGNDVG